MRIIVNICIFCIDSKWTCTICSYCYIRVSCSYTILICYIYCCSCCTTLWNIIKWDIKCYAIFIFIYIISCYCYCCCIHYFSNGSCITCTIVIYVFKVTCNICYYCTDCITIVINIIICEVHCKCTRRVTLWISCNNYVSCLRCTICWIADLNCCCSCSALWRIWKSDIKCYWCSCLIYIWSS